MTTEVEGLILKTCQLVKLCAFDAKMQKREMIELTSFKYIK